MFTLPFKKIVTEKEHGFTLLELIIVIIVIGILATVGLNSYTNQIEYGRTAEAKANLSAMRKLAYEYYLKNGTLTTITHSDLGETYVCSTNKWYRYGVINISSSYVELTATRCTSGGKFPDRYQTYQYILRYYPATSIVEWHCREGDWTNSCFGLPY